MQIDREDFLQEMKVRKLIRKGISTIQARRLKETTERLVKEDKLRRVIRKLISEGTATSDNDPAPHRSTGINVLEDLLKKIIPVLEVDFKKLTTSKEQRDSFRSHIVKAVEDTLAPPKITADAGEETDASKLVRVDEQDGLNIDLNDDGAKYIPIDKEEVAEEEPEDPRSEFGLAGQDETGRNVAFDTFKKISANIVDSYDILSADDDRDLFYDYLITNLKLYFDKFESDLTAVEEPTTDEYEAEQRASEEF